MLLSSTVPGSQALVLCGYRIAWGTTVGLWWSWVPLTEYIASRALPVVGLYFLLCGEEHWLVLANERQLQMTCVGGWAKLFTSSARPSWALFPLSWQPVTFKTVTAPSGVPEWMDEKSSSLSHLWQMSIVNEYTFAGLGHWDFHVVGYFSITYLSWLLQSLILMQNLARNWRLLFSGPLFLKVNILQDSLGKWQ